ERTVSAGIAPVGLEVFLTVPFQIVTPIGAADALIVCLAYREPHQVARIRPRRTAVRITGTQKQRNLLPSDGALPECFGWNAAPLVEGILLHVRQQARCQLQAYESGPPS